MESVLEMQRSTITVPTPLSTHKHRQNREMQKARFTFALKILLQSAGGGYHVLDKSDLIS